LDVYRPALNDDAAGPGDDDPDVHPVDALARFDGHRLGRDVQAADHTGVPGRRADLHLSDAPVLQGYSVGAGGCRANRRLQHAPDLLACRAASVTARSYHGRGVVVYR